MPALSALVPNGDASSPRAWASQSYLDVDEGLTSPDGNFIAAATDTNNNDTAFLLANTPVDLWHVTACSWQVRYALSGATGNDTYGLAVRIMSGATVLAAADSGGTFATVNSNITHSTSFTTSSVTAFAYVNATATKAQWDAAQVELRQTWTRTAGADGLAVRVDALEITGTYTSTQIAVTAVAETDTAVAIGRLKTRALGLPAAQPAGSFSGLLVNGDSTNGLRQWVFQSYLDIDEGFGTPDGVACYAAGAQDNKVSSFLLAAVPTDFDRIYTLVLNLRYYRDSSSDDQTGMEARIVTETDGVVLAAADAAGSFQLFVPMGRDGWANPGWKNLGDTGFTWVNGTATKAQWDDARIELNSRWTQVGTLDSSNGMCRIDTLALAGTYFTSATGEVDVANTIIGSQSGGGTAVTGVTETDTAGTFGKTKVRVFTAVTETATAVALGRTKQLAVGAPAEVDAAATLTLSKARTVTAATETDTALYLGDIKAVTGAAETDTAVAVGRVKSLAVGAPAETDAAATFARAKTKALTAATETDTSTTVGAAKARALAAAAETDVAGLFGITMGILAAVETDAATALARAKALAVGTPTETDTAATFGRAKAKAVTAPTEADTAATLARVKTRALGLAAETDAALTIAIGGHVLPVTGVTETDSAATFGRLKARTVGAPAEVDTAATLARAKTKALTAAADTSTATTLGRAKALALGAVAETDTAVSIGDSRAVVGATETDTALTVGRVKTLALVAAADVEAAATLARLKTLALGTVTETDVSLTITRPAQGGPITAVAETDTAVSFGRRKSRTLGIAIEGGGGTGFVGVAIVRNRTTYVTDKALAHAL